LVEAQSAFSQQKRRELQEELEILELILKASPSRRDQITEWKKRTGKSRRTFELRLRHRAS
jgi:hypothetical protein